MTPHAPPPPPLAAAAPDKGDARFGFANALLGETMSQWRASLPSRARAPCSPDSPGSAILVCHGAPVEFGGGYAARDLRFEFVEGRLAAISFKTSVDGFDFVTSAFKRRFGEPGLVVRDKIGRLGFPHVSMTWRRGLSRIVLSDPLTDYTHLGVRLLYEPLTSKLSASAAG